MMQAPPRTILEVFESLPEGTRCQLINEHIVMSPAPSYEHQYILKTIFRRLDQFFQQEGLGEIMFAPVDVYFGLENVYQPDIFFISASRLHMVKEGKIKGAPDLIIEVLSPGYERFDKQDKKNVYEQFGVKEYWIVDPSSKKVNGFQLVNNRYNEMPASQGTIQSSLLRLTIEF